MLRGSQVCSALRGLRPLGLACGHRCAALGLLKVASQFWGKKHETP